ncbi:MAG: hypothetical protein AAB262_01920 [Elusimicrobiota bacterium]
MMTIQALPVVILAGLCLGASPAGAQADLGASFSALSARVLATRLDLAARQAAYPRRFVSRGEQLPESCADLPVVFIRNGDIFKNDELLGRYAASHKENCDGLVVWQDSYGDLYRDGVKIAAWVQGYDVSWHGDIIVWQDSYGVLFRNGTELGRAQSYTLVKYTGDVVWQDAWSDLHRNQVKLGRAQRYAVAERTADVAWLDGFGILYRNDQELGRAQSWAISDRTGVVGWLDSYRNLYKNGVQVATGVERFSMREDGRIIWVDSSGRSHSA